MASIFCSYDITKGGIISISKKTSSFEKIIYKGEEYTPSESFTFDEDDNTIELVLKDGVTEIGYNTFGDCTFLTSIEIPDSVTSIGYGVFSGCTNLTSVVIGKNIKNISSYAFSDCTSLTSIEIPDSVTSINDGVFRDCTSLTSIEIPNSVTRIGDYAFGSCPLTSVEIPDSVTSIGERVFDSCTSLTSIEIPDSVTSIGHNAFNQCTSLASVVIGSGVTSIGDRTFRSCTSLTSITSKVKIAPTIESYTFFGVATGGTLYYPSGAEGYDGWLETSEYYLGYYGWKGEEYRVKSKNVVCRYNRITGTSGKIEVCYDTSAFSDMLVNGVSVGISEGYNFSGDTDMEIEFVLKNPTQLSSNVFKEIRNLRSVEIPDSVETINPNVFSGCTNLTSVVIGKNIKNISSYVFYGCTQFGSLILTGSIPTVSGTTFQNVKQFGTLYHPKGTDVSALMSTGSYYLGNYRWNSVEVDDDSPFTITCVYDVSTRSEPVKLCNTTYGVTNIFVDGNSVGVLTEYEFNSIGEHTVVFKMNQDLIFHRMFKEVDRLKKVDIGEGLYIIQEEVFRGCERLQEVSFPKKLSGIGQYSFADTPELKTITSYSQLLITLSSNSFENIATGGTFYYPKNSDYSGWMSNEQHYLGYYGWNAIAADMGYKPLARLLCTYDVTSTSSATKILHNRGCIANVIVDGVSLTNMFTYQFDSLGEHTVIMELKDEGYIGYDAFSEVTALKAIEIPSTVTFINTKAFYRCSKLKTIVSRAWKAPKVNNQSFSGITSNGTYYYPIGTDYSKWANTNAYYLGYYNWNGVETNFGDAYFNIEETVLESPQVGFATVLGYEAYGVETMDIIAPDWVVVTEDVGYFNIFTKPNETGEIRVGEVIFIANKNTKNEIQDSIIINQKASDNDMATSISFNTTKANFPVEGGVSYIMVDYINPNVIREPICAVEWVTVEFTQTKQSDMGRVRNEYRITAKPTTNQREVNITFSCTDSNSRIVANNSFMVYQEGASGEPEDTPNGVVEPFTLEAYVNADGTPDLASFTSIRCGYGGVTIMSPIIGGTWINLGDGTELGGVWYGYETVLEYPISFGVNIGAERVGTITFRGDTADGEIITAICKITQESAIEEPDEPTPDEPEDSTDETYSPIWKDIEYIFYSDDVTYQLFQDDKLIFKGRAYASPDDDIIKINVNKICQNYMQENLITFDGTTVGINHSYNTFKLKTESGVLLHTYHFVNDWSYKELTLGIKTEPIIPYIANGQRLFFSTFAQEQKAISWGMTYYDGKADYNNVNYVRNEFLTEIVVPERCKKVESFYFGDRRYTVLPQCKCKYVLYYLNPYGGYDWFPVTGRVTRRDKLETYMVTQNYNNTTTEFGKKRYLANVDVNYQINTQWLTQEQSDRMWELLESNTVWLHSLETDEIMPVIITDTEVEHKQKTATNKMLSYQINLELSQMRERL